MIRRIAIADWAGRRASESRGVAVQPGVPRTTLIGKMQRLEISTGTVPHRFARSGQGLMAASESGSCDSGKAAADSVRVIEMAGGL